MAIGDLYRLVHRGSHAAGEVLNRYFYFQTEGSGGAEELAAAFESIVLNPILNVLADTYTSEVFEILNISDPSEQIVSSAAGVGSALGAALPSYQAVAMRILGSTGLVREGAKRYGPIASGTLTGNAIAAGPLADWQALAAVLEDPIDFLTDVFQPVLYSPANTTHPLVDIITDIIAVEPTHGTTQSSRKSWVGE